MDMPPLRIVNPPKKKQYNVSASETADQCARAMINQSQVVWNADISVSSHRNGIYTKPITRPMQSSLSTNDSPSRLSLCRSVTMFDRNHVIGKCRMVKVKLLCLVNNTAILNFFSFKSVFSLFKCPQRFNLFGLVEMTRLVVWSASSGRPTCQGLSCL